MKTIILRPVKPCCDRPTRVVALVDFARETFERRCRPCSTVWHVERTRLADKNGIRVDRFEWTDKNTKLYRFKYGK